jgi:hypothetical protein
MEPGDKGRAILRSLLRLLPTNVFQYASEHLATIDKIVHVLDPVAYAVSLLIIIAAYAS